MLGLRTPRITLLAIPVIILTAVYPFYQWVKLMLFERGISEKPNSVSSRIPLFNFSKKVLNIEPADQQPVYFKTPQTVTENVYIKTYTLQSGEPIKVYYQITLGETAIFMMLALILLTMVFKLLSSKIWGGR